MDIKIVELQEVCEFLDNQRIPIAGSARKSGPYPYYGANGRQDWVDGYIFDEPLVLFAEDGGYFGSKTTPIAYKVVGKCWVNNHAHVLRPKPNCDVDFLHRILSFYDVTKFVNGTTREKLTKSLAERIPIPLPPLPEQKRIATILEKADRLRRLRRYALELSGTYLQTVFLEMFGDPVTNPKGWNTCPLKKLSLKFSDGPFGSNLKTEHYTNSGIRVIRLQNIGIGQLIDKDKVYISESHFDTLDKYRCIPGDVIVGTLGDPNLRACILPSSIPLALNKADCVQIRVNPEDATAEYICWLLNIPQTLFLATGMIHGQTRDRINMGRLAELEVPAPPRSLQQNFAQIVQKHERIQAQQREAVRQAEHLFQTLLHKAFQGELSLDEDEDEVLGPDVKVDNQRTPALANIVEPINRDAFQLVMPME